MNSHPLFKVRIHSITYAADGVLLFDLRSPDNAPLPEFTPGAHIDLHTRDGLMRSYSLMSDASDRHHYILGIKREVASRGGSAWMHEGVRPGAVLEVSGPRNHFALVEGAPYSVFIAGGIGITPLWSMVQRLRALGRPWELHYRARSRAAAPLLQGLAAFSEQGRVHVSFSDESSGRLDIARVVRDTPAQSHFYCCGPVSMIEAFQTACAGIDLDRVHYEYFAPKEAPATGGGFTVRLARSGREIPVAVGQTILESLKACGLDVPSSCQQGVCGACETKVLSGTPDHRDLVLSDAEKEAGQTMMICCSGSLSQMIELDL